MTPSNRPRHIVDMRARPSFLHSFFGAEPGSPDFETVRWINRRLGSKDIDHFTRAPDLPSFHRELDAAGIDIALMVGRSTPSVRISNDLLATLSCSSEGRMLGVGSVDPQFFTGKGAAEETERCLNELKLVGVNVDPAFLAEPISHDDETLFPIYEVCADLGAPVFMMSGPTTPDLRRNDPLAVDRVAHAFPTLPIVCCHAFYPQIDEMIAVAFRNENVFVSPDMYFFAPGGLRYADAARGFLADQLLFGSSYPFRPLGQSVADLLRLGLDEEAIEKVAWRNAAHLLRRDLA
ncbi:amidohydrolase [Methylosinus sp. H3A]|uniref:amidohydrolase family protein n=1 Tax=Methylosinus sp. H3A TaxID=2785786 RepID=UPI0018C220F7|nr:amidohydrolase family protein [Methylosinus sp. H3A]MBG0810009.1 amidohydrolase [Methylosinus sp. H3A]